MKQDKPIRVEIAPGELIDKITILQIKSERITEPGKRRNVHLELDVLQQAREEAVAASPELDELASELKRVNEALWEIEDGIRRCEAAKDFGARFVELARAVYRNNDERAAIKRRINEMLGSRIVEEKSYAQHEASSDG